MHEDLSEITIGKTTVKIQGVASSVKILDKVYSNEYLLKKCCMLKRGVQKGVESPYIINEVYINEHNDGYFYDVSSPNGGQRVIAPDSKIRVTFNLWNIFRPNNSTYVRIEEINQTCKFHNIIYDCSSLIDVSASVTLPTKLLTGPVTHFGEIKGIYYNETEGNIFLVSYNKEQYDLVPEDYLEILFKDNVEENNCRKHKVKSTKLTKKLLLRSSSRNDSGNDGLKAKKTKERGKVWIMWCLLNYLNISELLFFFNAVKCVLTT